MNAATLRREAARHGATVEENGEGRYRRFNVEAPAGKVWACAGDIHSLVVEWLHGDSKYREEAVADALERMGYGLADCDNPECDYCHPPEGA